MPLQHTYFDGYLKAHVTEERETRAAADVAALGALPQEWVDRLTILRTYLITCLECQADPDDLFAAKIKHYRIEWERTLAQAEAAQQALAPSSTRNVTPLSIPLERS